MSCLQHIAIFVAACKLESILQTVKSVMAQNLQSIIKMRINLSRNIQQLRARR